MMAVDTHNFRCKIIAHLTVNLSAKPRYLGLAFLTVIDTITSHLNREEVMVMMQC